MLKKTYTIFIFLAAIVTACSKTELNSHGVNEKILHIGNGDEVQTLDPNIASGIPESHILDALFEGLIVLDPKTLVELPGVAESWDISKDLLTYTFHLRRDAKWSNGDPVTAHDFVYSWIRTLTPEIASEYAYILFPLKNAKDFNSGKIKDGVQVGAKAIDDHKLSVTINSVTPYFLSVLAHHSFYPVHTATLKRLGAGKNRNTLWARPETLVSNGPFALKSWKLNSKLVVEKNPFYWDKDNVKLEEVHFYPINSRKTEEHKFRAGELHLTYEVPTNKIEIYRNKQPDKLSLAPWLGSYFYTVNTTKPPFNDVRVRRALAMAIDRESLVKNVAKGGQLPYGAYTPPNTRGYTPDKEIPFDVPGAQKLLAEAGYLQGKGFPKVEVLFNTAEEHRAIAEAVQQMWKKNLGIEVELINQDWKVYLDSINTINYDIVRRGWIGDYNDPSAFLEIFLSYSGQNQTGWVSKKYDELVEKAGQIESENERIRLYKEAERILLDETPLLPIYVYTRAYLKDPRLKGWHANILDRHLYKGIYLE